MAANATATLRAVDSNQPRLVHSPSQQSIAASDDYYSFSNNTTNSSRSKMTVLHYETPPSRKISPPANVANPVSHSSTSLPAGGQSIRTQRHSRPSSSGQKDSRPTETSSPTPGVDDSPYIRFAIDQLTRDEELRGKGRQGSIVTTDYPVDRIIPDEGLGYYSTPGPRTVRQMSPPRGSESSSERSDSPVPTEIFIAAEPPENTYRYPSLNFVPYSLRFPSICILIFLCLSMMAGLVFCNVWSQRNDGLWDYDQFGGSRYFVFEFLPQLLGISIVVLLFVVQAAVYRIAPLSIMARAGSGAGTLQRLPILPKNFVLPDLSYLRHGEILIGACLLIIWVVNWITVPLHSSLFQPRFYGSVSGGGFRWAPAEEVVWVLIAVYALLTCALLAIMVRFSWGKSGLQWDPVCLADIIPLIQKSNVLHDFEQSETSPAVEHHVAHRKLRLGYWQTSVRPELFYAIGEEGAPVWRESPHNSPTEKASPVCAPASGDNDIDVERQELRTKGSFERNLHSPFVRYRWAPWFLKDTFLVAWIVIAIVLLVAFITVSFVKRPIQNGFLPLLPTISSIAGFSSSNFLYSFIPALIGNFFFLAWQPIDVYFRAAQAYSDLSSPRGTSAERSLLLAYNSSLPLHTTIAALFAGHFKVAYISFVSIASLAIPVLSGGIFMARSYAPDNEIRISSYLPAYYTLLAFLIVYAFSFLVIWPRRKRYLPHPFESYADIISFLYQSSLLVDKVFREPKTKSDLVTRAIVAPPGESEKPSYAFGVYYGQDGKEHLGIDRLRKSARGGTSAEWGPN